MKNVPQGKPSATSHARPSSTLEALVAFSASLAAGEYGATLSDALDIVLSVASQKSGCAFVCRPDALELVSHRGLSSYLREELAELPTRDVPWFVAQRAVKTRRVAFDDKVASTSAGRLDENVLGPGFLGAVAFPIVSGLVVRGVIVVGGREAPSLDVGQTAWIQATMNIVAIALARDQHLAPEPRRRSIRPKAFTAPEEDHDQARVTVRRPALDPTKTKTVASLGRVTLTQVTPKRRG